VMIFMIVFLTIETIALIASLYYNYKLGVTMLRVQDAIEESLDALDKRYNSISKILKVPLFYDSPEIKRAVEDIKKSREAILYVANQLTSIQEEEEESGSSKTDS